MNLKYIKGLLFLNIASVNVLLKGGIKNFSNFIIEIKSAYLQIKMTYEGIKMIRLEEISKRERMTFLPIDLCKPGSTPWYDLLVLATLVKKYQPKVIFEIGTFEGFGSLVMCNNCSNEVLYSLDLPLSSDLAINISPFTLEEHSIDSRYKSGRFFDLIRPEVRISRLYGDSWNFDYSTFHNSVDFIFIDGAHTYQYVLKDALNAIKCVYKEGVIVWHDVKNSQVLNPILKLASYFTIYHVLNSNICFTVINTKRNEVLQILQKELRAYE